MSSDDLHLRAVDAEPDAAREAHDGLEAALFEVKRVIVGQEEMLERLLVALLAGGHVLLEGVPGLAKTLTVKTLADVLGGSFKRLQFTPDLVPADLVGTRIYRPDTGAFDTELGPVFCNFLLADEINRAPAKVQSALLEVMQERQVTIGHETHRVPEPVPRAGHPEPDRVRGHLPAARGPGRPLHVQARRRLPRRPPTRSPSSSARSTTRPRCARCSRPSSCSRHQQTARERLRRPARDGVRRRPHGGHPRDPPSRPRRSTRAGSSSARARAARSTWSTPAARWRSCAAATTCCPATCATSPATCCATASC